jgi:GNAT superfamily N-acetyltransferase
MRACQSRSLPGGRQNAAQMKRRRTAAAERTQPRSISYRRTTLVNSRTIPHVQDEGAWSVVCFVVRPGCRRRGLMHQLLEGAVGHAHAMGATALEGYPVDPGSERIDQTSGYVGTVQFFEAHRFRRVRQTAGRRGGKPRWLVRREFP